MSAEISERPANRTAGGLAGVEAAGDGVEGAGVDGLALDGGVAFEAAADRVHLRGPRRGRPRQGPLRAESRQDTCHEMNWRVS